MRVGGSTNPLAQLIRLSPIPFMQRRPNVFDVGPTLYKCYKKCFVFAGLRVNDLNCRPNTSVTIKKHLF